MSAPGLPPVGLMLPGNRRRLAEEWRDLARRVRIDGPIPTELNVVDSVRDVVLEVFMKVPDINSGLRTIIVFQQPLRLAPHVELLREYVRKAWLHELDERFTVDGERPFNPHAAEAASEIARRP